MKNNVIPPMTHELSRHWKQPPTSEILIDDEYAVMERTTFERLSEYSATNPTGAYEGKMWRRHDGAFDQRFLAAGGKPVWMLCWYGESEKPDHVSNNYRKIILADEVAA